MWIAFFALVRKDLRLFLTDRRAVIMSVVAPIAIASFFGYIFGNGGGGNEDRSRIAILISDEDVGAYLREHAAQFKELKPQDAHDAARERLTEERVNAAFEKWLDGAHGRAQIEYHEAGLQ